MLADSSPSWRASLEAGIGHWNQEHIVSSPDIDGLVCAAILSQAYEARWIGLYTTKHLILFDDFDHKAALKAVWVDQDINHSSIVSIGQHIILRDEGDQLLTRHPRSFNPNIHFNQFYSNSFHRGQLNKRDKYPFGTCHMLMHLLGGNSDNLGNKEKAVLAHADGALSSTQKYRGNCEMWIKEMFPDNEFFRSLLNNDKGMCDVRKFHNTLIQDLIGAGMTQSSTGKGAQFKRLDSLIEHKSASFDNNSDRENLIIRLNAVISVLCRDTIFNINQPKKITDVIVGDCTKSPPNTIEQGAFDRYLSENHIFSHAFVQKKWVKFTTMKETPLYK